MSKDQPRLGRGLSSLISPTAIAPTEPATHAAAPPPPAPGTSVAEIDVRLIDPNPLQPRRWFNQERLQSLAESLQRDGTLQPVVVRRRGERYELVAGERRWRAAQLAGMSRIPAILRDASDSTLLELALIENLQREDLNSIERARAYLQLSSKFNLSHDEIARRMGEDRSTVTNYIRLLDLSDDILTLLAENRLSMGHARSLLAVGRPEDRSALAQRIVTQDWSVRRTEEHIASLRQQKSQISRPPARPVISDMETRISTAVGLRVRIAESRRKNSGRVIIDYHSLDDFERLTARLGVPAE